MKIAPYGSWESPVTSDLIVEGFVGLGQIELDDSDVYWIESRPTEGGRSCIVRQNTGGETTDVTPPEFNARTRVHEYGGGDFVVLNGTVYFSNFSDQRLYRQLPGTQPVPITPPLEMRYADSIVDVGRNRLITVREDHIALGGEPVNSIVSIDLDVSDKPQKILAAGSDFYSSPRLSPDGARLAWVTWEHPNMPWDESKLWTAEFTTDGSLGNVTLVAGGAEESIFQPEWSPGGAIYFVSDRSGWWNLYRAVPGSEAEILFALNGEFGLPQWVFGMSMYAFESPNRIICAYIENGISHLATFDTETRKFKKIETPYTDITYVQARAGQVIFRGGSPREPASIVRIGLEDQNIEVLRRAGDLVIDSGDISEFEAMAFPTEGGLTAHGFFYAPKNRNYRAPADELPPLLVKSHGGPTAATTTAFSLSIQYWTSRGFAVLDVNYGGSTGYGRAYRQRLKDKWGIVDVDDCVNGVEYLVQLGLVDRARCAIDGGSAGGYTTLCALTFRDVFKAGASHFGVSDLEALVKDTHKFESRYLENLIGPYPERADLYRERSPIHFTEQLACPVIFFQGLEDKVVLPNQAEMMVEALRKRGLPVAYVPFEGEQHGFRRAKNIKRSLDGELYFYSRIFRFNLAVPVEPVEIENLRT